MKDVELMKRDEIIAELNAMHASDTLDLNRMNALMSALDEMNAEE